jgi:hypothetical protein
MAPGATAMVRTTPAASAKAAAKSAPISLTTVDRSTSATLSWNFPVVRREISSKTRGAFDVAAHNQIEPVDTRHDLRRNGVAGESRVPAQKFDVTHQGRHRIAQFMGGNGDEIVAGLDGSTKGRVLLAEALDAIWRTRRGLFTHPIVLRRRTAI